MVHRQLAKKLVFVQKLNTRWLGFRIPCRQQRATPRVGHLHIASLIIGTDAPKAPASSA
jgi:hypothetical protein